MDFGYKFLEFLMRSFTLTRERANSVQNSNKNIGCSPTLKAHALAHKNGH